MIFCETRCEISQRAEQKNMYDYVCIQQYLVFMCVYYIYIHIYMCIYTIYYIIGEKNYR